MPRAVVTATVAVLLLTASPSFVQKTEISASDPASAIFPGASTTGDTIIVAALWSPVTAPLTVTDTMGNSYAPVSIAVTGQGSLSTYVQRFFIASDIRAGGAPMTITCSVPAGTTIECVSLEYASLPSATVISQVSGTAESASAFYDAGTITTTQPRTVLISWVSSLFSNTTQPTSTPWLARSMLAGDLVQDLITDTPGPYAVVAGSSSGIFMGQGIEVRTVFDAGSADAGSVDAGSADSGSVDAGSVDAGSVDAGSVDAGSVDAGSADSGSVDAGSVDSGSVDAGASDAGGTDAGGDGGDVFSSFDASVADAGPQSNVDHVGCDCQGTSGAVTGILAAVVALLSLRRASARN